MKTIVGVSEIADEIWTAVGAETGGMHEELRPKLLEAVREDFRDTIPMMTERDISAMVSGNRPRGMRGRRLQSSRAMPSAIPDDRRAPREGAHVEFGELGSQNAARNDVITQILTGTSHPGQESEK